MHKNKRIILANAITLFLIISAAYSYTALADETCVIEGGNAAVGDNQPQCCTGLTKILPKDPNFLMDFSGICTAKCGNSVCDAITENTYNCLYDCKQPRADSIGFYRPAENKFYIRKGGINGGIIDVTISLSLAEEGPIAGRDDVHPIVGDWNNDGVDSIGLYTEGNPKVNWKHNDLNKWYLKNLNTDGNPDTSFNECRGRDLPFVGDWDGDGMDGIGCFRERYVGKHLFYIKQSPLPVSSSASPSFGKVGSKYDIPFSGDWNGDGKDTIGFYNPLTTEFFLCSSAEKNTKISDCTSTRFGEIGDKPLIGDWDGDGKDTIGVYRSYNSTFYLSISIETPDTNPIIIKYGRPGDIPISGKFFDENKNLCTNQCGNSQCDSSGSFLQGSACPETKSNCPQDCSKKCSAPDAYEGMLSCSNSKLKTCTENGWKDKRKCGKYSWETGKCAKEGVAINSGESWCEPK